MWEHHRIVFGVRLVTSFSYPSIIWCYRRMESPREISEQRKTHISAWKGFVLSCRIYNYKVLLLGTTPSSQDANDCDVHAVKL